MGLKGEMIKKIFIGADHRGFKLKSKIKTWLESWDVEAIDLGARNFDPTDDYTLYAEKVAVMVRDTKGAGGILLCGSGVGVDIAANKFDGIRASIGKNTGQVKSGRKDDNMNILVLAADHTKEKEAKEILRAFVNTKFDGKERHKRRLREIEKIEANN